MKNIILNTDSYKASHYLQYPPGTKYINSYIESRGGQFSYTVFFGLQMFIKEYLLRPITLDDINEAEKMITAHGLPFNREGWDHIFYTHGGYLPLEIEAVPEGTIVPTGNVLVQVRNTDPACAWLVSYIETALLRAVWYPTTVCTLSHHGKQVIKKYLEQTSDNIDGLDFKLHDFGSRGASSEETAAIGGLAHLINFKGTDTLSAIFAARKYYNESMAGYSIPASEHSTITSWGKDEEVSAYKNMLEQFSGKGKLVAVVSDSYDLWNAIDNIWGDELKELVVNNGGTLVIRPDSGDPVEVVIKTIQKLMNKFGFTFNSKGHKVLPDYVRVIQGDGVSLETIDKILSSMKNLMISADNVAFGMGAELLQKVNRDTQKFAMKTSAISFNEESWVDVYKDPVTDSGKRSKRGVLKLVAIYDHIITLRKDFDDEIGLLVPVYYNSNSYANDNLDTIRKRANNV